MEAGPYKPSEADVCGQTPQQRCRPLFGGGAAGNGVSGIFAGSAGTTNQGYGGGTNGNLPYRGGSGGGAGAAGGNQGANGGVGLSNSISGSAVFYAGGGGSYDRPGGTGGGGTGSGGGVTAGTVNTGGGAGCGTGSGTQINNGGSGIVILRHATTFQEPESISAGLTYTRTVVSGNVIFTFTAGTGTVSW